MSKHETIPRDLTENITVLRKCKGKFECLLYEMLLIEKEKPPLNIQSDSLRAKLFLSLDNENKMCSKRRAINLVSLLFLLISESNFN